MKGDEVFMQFSPTGGLNKRNGHYTVWKCCLKGVIFWSDSKEELRQGVHLCVYNGVHLHGIKSGSLYLALPVIVGKNAAPLLYLFSFVSEVWLGR